MSIRVASARKTRTRLVAAVLLALALRALIPLGFMPSSDGSLSLMICPGGFPPGLLPDAKGGSMSGMGMPGHPSGGQGAMDDGYCIFTTGFGATPLPFVLAAPVLRLAVITAGALTAAAPASVRLVHLPQARAPPARL